MSYTKELDAVNSLSNPISNQSISNQGGIQAQSALQDNQNSIGLEHTAYADTADTVEREINRAGSGTNKTGSETNRVGSGTSKTGDDTNKIEPESPTSYLKIALALLKVFKVKFDEDEIAAKVAAFEIKQLHQSFLFKPQEVSFNEIKTGQIRYAYYLTLICKIKEHQNSLVYTDMLLDELCRSCYDLLTLDYMGLFCKLIDDAPIAMFLALMHDKLRSFYLTDDKLFTSGMAENIAAAHVPSSIQVPSNITAPDSVPSILSEVTEVAVNRVVERAEGRGSILERGKAYVGIEDYQIRQKLCAALQTHQVLLSQYMHTLSGRTSSATYGGTYGSAYSSLYDFTYGSAYGGTHGGWKRALPQGIKCLIVQSALHKGSMVCPAGHPELAKTQAELEYRFCVFDGLDYFFTDAADTLSFLWVNPHKHVEPSYEQSLMTSEEVNGVLDLQQQDNDVQKQSSQNPIQQPIQIQAVIETDSQHDALHEQDTMQSQDVQIEQTESKEFVLQWQNETEATHTEEARGKLDEDTQLSQDDLQEQDTMQSQNVQSDMQTQEVQTEQNESEKFGLQDQDETEAIYTEEARDELDDDIQLSQDDLQEQDTMQTQDVQTDQTETEEYAQQEETTGYIYEDLIEALKIQNSVEQICGILKILSKNKYPELCQNFDDFFMTFYNKKPLVIMLSLLYPKIRVFYFTENSTKGIVKMALQHCPDDVLPKVDFNYQDYIKRHAANLSPYLIQYKTNENMRKKEGSGKKNKSFVELEQSGHKCLIVNGANKDILLSLQGSIKITLEQAKKQGCVFDGLKLELPAISPMITYFCFDLTD